MGELSETTLKKKVKQTINKCVKNKQFKKIMDQVQKKSKTKIDFWQNIIKPKYNKIYDMLFNFIIKQKNIPKIFSYMYSEKFKNQLNIKNKKKKTNLVKEIFIMKILTDGVKVFLKNLKKQNKAIKRQKLKNGSN
jgi:hypothetical protein